MEESRKWYRAVTNSNLFVIPVLEWILPTTLPTHKIIIEEDDWCMAMNGSLSLTLSVLFAIKTWKQSPLPPYYLLPFVLPRFPITIMLFLLLTGNHWNLLLYQLHIVMDITEDIDRHDLKNALHLHQHDIVVKNAMYLSRSSNYLHDNIILAPQQSTLTTTTMTVI